MKIENKNNWEMDRADSGETQHRDQMASHNPLTEKTFPSNTKYQRLKRKVDRLHASWGFNDPATAMG